ncbi:hypothetical protein [Nocardia sp. NPDC047038]|uniref:hypothetical protein n=1 Tax=Nocardia sp. NPDC047038 TaxID=3154338 RepID=UPI0033CCE812
MQVMLSPPFVSLVARIGCAVLITSGAMALADLLPFRLHPVQEDSAAAPEL